ncbi:MAG: tetratricopeptide repeat protein [Ignavibacteria bacterium]|nr:tetratricopeptide repeat protein [Ignavibacteria bacterium]
MKKGEYMSSITFSEKALTFIFKKIGKNNVYAVTFCSYIGNAYSELGEFGKALIYFEKAQNILSKLKIKIPFDEAALYNNIATCYSKRTRLISSNYHNKEEVNKAILNYKISLKIYLKLYGENNKVVADLFNNLGIISRIKKFDTAREYLFRSNEIYCKLYGNSCLPVSISLFNLAFYYKGIKNYRKAIESANRSLAILLKLKGLENFKTKRYNFLSLIYLELKDYKQSLKYNDLELSSIRKHFASGTNDFNNADANLTILESLSTRANINRSMYKETCNKEYLLNAFDNYTKVIELLDILRLQYFYEDSKNILTIKSVTIYEKAIEVCIGLYRIS